MSPPGSGDGYLGYPIDVALVKKPAARYEPRVRRPFVVVRVSVPSTWGKRCSPGRKLRRFLLVGDLPRGTLSAIRCIRPEGELRSGSCDDCGKRFGGPTWAFFFGILVTHDRALFPSVLFELEVQTSISRGKLGCGSCFQLSSISSSSSASSSSGASRRLMARSTSLRKVWNSSCWSSSSRSSTWISASVGTSLDSRS